MLNLKVYISEIDDLEPGQTVRLNHTDCEAGEDTRRRLYLTRTLADEEKVIGYCHNCQQGGYYNDGSYQKYRQAKHGPTGSGWPPEVVDIVQEPKGMVKKISDWPTAAKAWAYSRGISQSDANWYHIKYDPSTDRVFLPRWAELDRRNEDTGILVGYQLRAIHEYQTPKYLTAQMEDCVGYTLIHPQQDLLDYVVVVEDLVSGIHIIRATEQQGEGANLPGVYVNYGTKVDPTLMYNIAYECKWATIWLDNDNQHVVNQATMMERTIKMYSSSIKVARVEEASDPKHYEPTEICTILDEVWNG